MKGMHHPNIIQFEHVYETENQLLVVMEYAPGKELFDVSNESNKGRRSIWIVYFFNFFSNFLLLKCLEINQKVILEKSKFTEEEAKPIFYQIASAISYMHRLIQHSYFFYLSITHTLYLTVRELFIVILNQRIFLF